MNNFSGMRSIFDAADALLRRVKSVFEPDGNPHSTLARGLVDVTGNVVATADSGAGLPTVLVKPDVAVEGNLLAFDANGKVVDSGSASAGSSAAAAEASALRAEASATAAAASLAALGKPFSATATLTSAAAATPVAVLADVAVGAGKKVYITGFVASVNGSTEWGTATKVTLQDSNGAPVEFFELAAASLIANAELRPGSEGVTAGAAYLLGTGGTTAKGLELVADDDGTGSNLVVTVWGFIK